jgi:type IV secretory pathway TraG/TraD family ATPase VirD4
LYWLSKQSPRQKLATARWAGGTEKVNARKMAIQQINQRKHNEVTTWINAPQITPISSPLIKAGTAKPRFNVQPKPQTVFVPDTQRGVAVCGAPGSGKTYSVIDPMARSVIEQGFPIILYDFKFPEGQTASLAAYARQQGYDVKVFAPGFEGSEICNLLDFLKSAEDGETAAQIAKVLNRNFSLNGGKGGEDPFFQMSGDQLVKAVLQLAKLTPHADLLTCQKILAIEPTELIDRLKRSEINPWIKVSWEQFMSLRESEKTAASVAATASLMFTNFVAPDILPCLCGDSTMPLDLQGKQMLIFGMDQRRRDVIGPILATVLHMIVVHNVSKKRQDPLAVFLDELPTIALPSLVNWLNESRSAGFCGVLGYQNMTQLEKAYGKESTRALLSGCNTKFIFNPGELESAEYFSKYFGDEEVRFRQKSRSYGKGNKGRTVSEQERIKKMIAPEEILKLPAGQCIFVNPAYSNGDEASLPTRLRVQITKAELAKAEFSQSKFPRMVKRWKKYAKLQPITSGDMRGREQAIDVLLPPLVEVPEHVPSQMTLDSLLRTAAADFDA